MENQEKKEEIEENYDENQNSEMKEVKCLTTKQLKALARPEFEQNPDKFYPTQIFKKIGFSRNRCPKCKVYYWRCSEKRETCGDSNCIGQYTFIGKQNGKSNKKMSYSEAWKSFEKSFTSARIPCTSIERYPVVARWRNDVDYVAAGIYCFQPYCVTGELDPPANPLICPQFCVRFNDLDNIGLTGRHYSGFIMLGIQVFNYPNDYKFFKEECVEFNYNWLTEGLGIDKEEITFIEDVWAGGGNLGPSIEYFVHGLEVGNMVFMQYKTFPDGTREELDIKIIDTGIGLERIPWLVNGSATSYLDVFGESFNFLQEKIQVSMNSEIWEKLGPYTSMLNIDEVEDIDKTWKDISEKIGVSLEEVKKAIIPIKDMYIILDHTRTALMIINDGSLPSNVGGGSNVRNIIRRVFAILKKNGWWDMLGFDGLIQLFVKHKEDLSKIYGPFKDYKSFKDIIKMELVRYENTDQTQKLKLDKLLKKSKQLSIDDWILAITSYGIAADQVAQITGQAIPGNLYYEIALRQEQITKVAEPILYQTSHIPETVQLFYDSNSAYEFSAQLLDVFVNLKDQNKKNIVILDQTLFYPTSGGQQNDEGILIIGDKEYKVLNVEKVGKVILHIVNKEIDIIEEKIVKGKIDIERRNILRNHHSATHIVFASCRQILGPHVWQAGAKKTTEQAHLDITHYNSLTKEQEIRIENMANSIILENKDIQKYVINKAEAEKQFGFRLYQGGIVPGNQLRVVNIVDTDVEACCGTHCDNTSQVGWVKLLKTHRISDGILRLYFVAGQKSMERLNYENRLLNSLCDIWSINKPQIVPTAERFFKDYKKLNNENKEKDLQILNCQVQIAVMIPNSKIVIRSDHKNPTLYFGNLSKYALKLKNKNSSIVFVGNSFVFGIQTDKSHFDFNHFTTFIKSLAQNVAIKQQDKLEIQVQTDPKKKSKIKVDNINQFSCLADIDVNKIIDHFIKEYSFIDYDQQ